MTDIVDKKTRSRMMSGIRSKNTKPELLIRSQLHKMGFRFRIHVRELPGKPDIVLKKYNAVIMVNGCFWHHHNCDLFKWPKTRPDFWKKKIELNATRDVENIASLKSMGWRICTIWECAIKGRKKMELTDIINLTVSWLKSEDQTLEISG